MFDVDINWSFWQVFSTAIWLKLNSHFTYSLNVSVFFAFFCPRWTISAESVELTSHMDSGLRQDLNSQLNWQFSQRVTDGY